ncbi:MAG TPA: GAF domain-containing sensor histidine kinase [Actinomycetota bacterium]|nr:GAF domain-containing sensor histidine kinase [Actinomycetota bacterium]
MAGRAAPEAHGQGRLEQTRRLQPADNRAAQLATLQEVGSALLKELDPDKILTLITHRAKLLTRSHTASLARRTGPDSLRLDFATGRHARSVKDMVVPIQRSLAGKTMQTGQSHLEAHVDDEAWERFPFARALAARSVMFAPVSDHREVVGVLCLAHAEPHHFGPEDLGLLELFASLATIAMRNARLFEAERASARAEALLAAESAARAEESQRRLRQLGSLQEVGAALIAEVVPHEVLRLIAKRAKEVTGARSATIARRTGPDTLRLEVAVGRGAARAVNAEVSIRGSVSGLTITSGLAQLVADVNAHPGVEHPIARTFEARSAMFAPLVEDGKAVGVLAVAHGEANRFSGEDLDLLELFANLASVALRNADLFEAQKRAAETHATIAAEAQTKELEAQRRLLQLRSLHEVGAALVSEVVPNQVLRLIAERAMEVTGARSATIGRRCADNTLCLEVAVGRGATKARNAFVPIEGSVSGQTMTSGRAHLVEDVEAHAGVEHPIARALDARSAMFAPLFDEGETVGVLAVAHGQASRFSRDDLGVLELFADLASMALHNAHLFEAQQEASRAEKQLALATAEAESKGRLLSGVINAQEEERARLARDLHDTGAQALTSVLLGLKVAEQGKSVEEIRRRIDEMRDLTSEAIREIRQIAVSLRPPVLDDLGLEAALDRLTSDFESRSGIKTRVRLSGCGSALDSDVQTALYRVVQEALNNAAKHSRASTVSIHTEESESGFRLWVRDDGQGFDASKRTEGLGLGLEGMRERAELAGGHLTVTSAPGRGTTVELEVRK